MNIRSFYYSLHPWFRFAIRRIVYFPNDFFTRGILQKDTDIPPRGLNFVGGGDFRSIGDAYLRQFIQLADLKPNSRVLDVGCGIGRIALPLTKYLNREGSYEGFDVVKIGIDWSTKHITSKFPNFRFTWVDLKNDLYAYGRSNRARDFRFPYADHEFDFVLLTSVFTHMLPDDMANYLREIHRVMKPTGRCYATFFILNTASKLSMAENDGFSFTHHQDDYWMLDKQLPEANVAYEEHHLINHYLKQAGLRVDQIHYGFWSGRPKSDSLGFQDTLIITKC